MALIKLKQQPRHVLIGLAKKHWKAVRGYFPEAIIKAGPKGANRLSNVALLRALRNSGLGA